MVVARDKNWQTHVVCAQARADAIARGDDVPLAPAIVAMMDMWQTSTAGGGDNPETAAAPLDERLQSFLPLAYNTALQTDKRWSAADLFERLDSLLAALFAAKTHPPEEIAAAMKKVTARAFIDETAQQRYEKYYFLIVAVGAVVVFSAPWMAGPKSS
jgi:hypothetical protein